MDLSDTGRTIYLCDKCGRVGHPGSEEVNKWWLVSSPPLSSRFIARCPLHLNEYAMRVAGVPRTKTFRRWLSQAQQWAQDNYEMLAMQIPHAHPYPMEGPFSNGT